MTSSNLGNRLNVISDRIKKIVEVIDALHSASNILLDLAAGLDHMERQKISEIASKISSVIVDYEIMARKYAMEQDSITKQIAESKLER